MTKKKTPVVIVESAAADLEDILDWYREELVPDVGIELVKRVRKRLTQLQTFPEIGREVPEFNDPTIRELIESPFRIVYRFDGEIASIVRVWRSERLMKDLQCGSGESPNQSHEIAKEEMNITTHKLAGL